MRTHPVNVTYLVVSVIFLGVAASWALREWGVIDLGEVRWLVPLSLVVAGIIGLIALATKSARTRRATPGSTYYDTDYSNPEGDTR